MIHGGDNAESLPEPELYQQEYKLKISKTEKRERVLEIFTVAKYDDSAYNTGENFQKQGKMMRFGNFHLQPTAESKTRQV